MLKNFRFYGTSACHLCELARAMIETQQSPEVNVIIEELDISESDELFDRYGVSIPVLQHPDGRELNWPFSVGQVRDFLVS
jgi:hypothetical protein